MILPERVLGRFSRKTISLGATAGPSRLRAWPRRSSCEVLARLVAGLQRDEGLDHLADRLVGNADDADLGDGRMLHQRAFDLERVRSGGPALLMTSSSRPTNQK